MVVFVVQRIDRYSYICVYLVLLLYQALLSNLVTFLLDKKTGYHFDLRIRWTESSDFGQKIDFGPSDSQNQILSYRILQYRTA